LNKSCGAIWNPLNILRLGVQISGDLRVTARQDRPANVAVSLDYVFFFGGKKGKFGPRILQSVFTPKNLSLYWAK
jgi:hypothetical protein